MELRVILRLLFYFFFTAIVFVSVFIPEILYIYYLIHINDILPWLLSGLILPLEYLLSVIMFGLIHSHIICRILLPKVKSGHYHHDSNEAKLFGVAVVSPGVYKSMLKAFSFVPHLYSMLIAQALRLYGLKVGKNVYVSAGSMIDSHLVTIGSNCFIGIRAIISAHITEDRVLIISPVKIGNNVTIGGNTIVAPGAEIGDNCIVGINSYVKKNQRLEPNYIYAGTPVKKIKEIKKNHN